MYMLLCINEKLWKTCLSYLTLIVFYKIPCMLKPSFDAFTEKLILGFYFEGHTIILNHFNHLLTRRDRKWDSCFIIYVYKIRVATFGSGLRDKGGS